jgi:hypothetical protein
MAFGISTSKVLIEFIHIVDFNILNNPIDGVCIFYFFIFLFDMKGTSYFSN